MNKFGITEKLLTEIIDVIKDYPEVNRARIFGSRAMGNYKKYSDIDIALYGDFDLLTLQSVHDDLEELDCIYLFDVLHYDKLQNENLRIHIDQNGMDIYIN